MALGEKTKILWQNLEYREHMRQSHLGQKPWNKGIKIGSNPDHAEKLRGRKMPLTTGEKHWNWKGDTVKYGSLHDYLKYHFSKFNKCFQCNEIKNLDLDNISQKYKRELSDWEWLCRRCHMIKDGRMEKLIINNKKRVLSLI